MEQAMIGPSPNPLILSYLKYAISSQARLGAFLCKRIVLYISSVFSSIIFLLSSLYRWCLIPVYWQLSARYCRTEIQYSSLYDGLIKCVVKNSNQISQFGPFFDN